MRQTTLLIVDDVPQVRQELRLLLSLAGPITVVGEAADGPEALSLAEGLHPDVVLLDLEMPTMDGYAVCRLLKQRRLANAVVVLSIHSRPEEVQAAIVAGADRFVAKGANLELLLQAILQPAKERRTRG
jgi:pilus assembly protein CpaE